MAMFEGGRGGGGGLTVVAGGGGGRPRDVQLQWRPNAQQLSAGGTVQGHCVYVCVWLSVRHITQRELNPDPRKELSRSSLDQTSW